MNQNDIRIYNYCDYSSNNYGSSRAVQLGSLTLYFSYETVIAFNSPKTGLIIRENSWSTTTGRHLNAIDPDKKIRFSSEQFESLLDQLLESYELKEQITA